ncbi:hypothetical protein ACGFMM_05545 [Streptomyces sp. NPDC048604]|uniref:hypothetical protein n=1 Tax=Streptomyces sp. NPDC048604 TaxID=3365578 RepID=UPI00372466D7
MTVHCPYLAPSLRQGLTSWTVYRTAGEADAVEAELFHAGVHAAERLRRSIHRPRGSLRCENVVILGEVPGIRIRELMAWPHWVLKHLYGPVGVMFGKFCAGEEERTRSGERIPVSPVSFIPVRAAVPRRDPEFLRATPDLAAALAVAEEDGRDVFQHIPHDWTEIRTWAKRFLPLVKPSNSSGSTSARPSLPGS